MQSQENKDYSKYRGGDDRIDQAGKLKLCSTCTGTAGLKVSKIYGCFMVKCSVCGKRTIDYQNPYTAIDAWNTKNS